MTERLIDDIIKTKFPKRLIALLLHKWYNVYHQIVRRYIQMNENISTLVIKMDKELHRQMKINCATDGISQKAYVIELIKKDMAAREKKGDKK